ncbi:hypothetical protein EU545_00445 [Candidatus Thorarchaeota archaeon]|nr:MAG: hypothetical protein EU545_00445 [Candidatus Thorarchaeota archaeon]
MSGEKERPRILRAIKKCLTDADQYFKEGMEALDEIGRSSVATGMTPLIGGYGMKDGKSEFRTAMIKVDSGEKALEPLVKRFKDGRVNESHFKSEKALVILNDLAEADFDILVNKLMENKGRESVWYRLRELRGKISEILVLVADE